ncbi:acyltransferase family protein [Enterobacter sp.]|uniref:acyltransferase family protein n=1 Tax=Enterobacter sp. TaxID=42895 RepID=UPI00296E90FF|nr:acyltransferase family protein [Enterobacter sp.]
MDKQTSLSIDYAKTIGITLVVIGHTAWKPFQTLDPYYFHMPLFFFIGGFLCSGRKTLLKVTQNILFKYVLYTAVTYTSVALIAVFIQKSFSAPINVGQPFINGIIKTIAFAFERNFHNNLYFLVGWFLLAYAISFLLLNIYLKISQKILNKSCKLAVGITVLTVSIVVAYILICNKERNWGQLHNLTTQVIMAFSFMLLGNLSRNIDMKFNNILVAVSFFIFISWMISNKLYGLPVMAWSKYPPNVFFFFICASSAIYVVMFISNCIAVTCGASKLIHLSTYSKSIMSYHLVFFLFIDAVNYKLFNYHIELATPTKHYYTPKSWVFYIVLPLVFIPLFAFVIDKTKILIKAKFSLIPPKKL